MTNEKVKKRYQSDADIKITGHVKVFHKSKLIYEGKNLVVNAGLGLIATLLGAGGTRPSYMAVGSDSTTPAGADTALLAELYRPAATPTVLSNTVSYAASFTGLNGTTKTVAEFGLFTLNAAGTMLCRFVCPSFSWAPTEVLTVVWTINIGELA